MAWYPPHAVPVQQGIECEWKKQLKKAISSCTDKENSVQSQAGGVVQDDLGSKEVGWMMVAIRLRTTSSRNNDYCNKSYFYFIFNGLLIFILLFWLKLCLDNGRTRAFGKYS